MPAAAISPQRQNAIREAQAAFEQRIRTARVNLAAFIEFAGRDENGGRIELDYLHRSWVVHVNYAWNRGLHAMLMAPFNSGKTSTMAVPLAAFLIGQNPQVRIKFVCANDDMAKLRVASVKSLIESYEYRKVFPAIQPGKKWETQEVFVKREGHASDPTLQARGVLTEGIGSRADYLIFDDVCTQANSEELASREKIKARGKGTWISRLDGPEARAMAFATAWASDDFTMYLKDHKKWCTLVQRVKLPLDTEQYEQDVYADPSVDLSDYPIGSLTA